MSANLEIITNGNLPIDFGFGIPGVVGTMGGLAIDPATNDLYLDAAGHLAVVIDGQAAGEHARQRLLTHHGEWFLDKSAGVRWLEFVLGKKERNGTQMAETLIKAEILETPGITAISGLSTRFDRKLRHLETWNATVTTQFDDSEVSI